MKGNIVIYGNIYTVDKNNPKASALAISTAGSSMWETKRA